MKWTHLKALADVAFIRNMYIWIIVVPIVSKAFSKVERYATVRIFEYEFQLVTELPFSWAVFFYSAIIFVVANLIYLWKCPKIVQQNTDYSDFVVKGRTVEHLTLYSAEQRMSAEEIHSEVDVNVFNNVKYLQVEEPDREDKQVRRMFWLIHQAAENHAKTSRNVVFALYVLGGLLLGCVVVQNILTVVRHNIESYSQETGVAPMSEQPNEAL